jgi:hypothetical protein
MNTWIELINEPVKSEVWGLNLSYPDIKDLLPVAVVFGISILLSVLWLLAVWEYTCLKSKYLRKS